MRLISKLRFALLSVDVKLFTRTTRRVELTPAGHTLFPHARKLLAEADAGRDAVAATTGKFAGALRVGAEQCLGSVNVPQSVSRKDIAADLRVLSLEQRDAIWTVNAAYAHSEKITGLTTEFLSLLEPH